MISIDIILPVHNEASHIASSLRHIQAVLKNAEFIYRLIVVDDGSRDGTHEEVEKLKDERIVCLRLSKNFGKDAAIKAGIDFSDADALITMDSDLQHPPQVILSLVSIWLLEECDIVHAVKQNRGKESKVRKVLVYLYFRLSQFLIEIDLTNQSDFKLLSRDVAQTIKKLPENNFYYRGIAAWIGYKSATVPFTVQDRISGKSKWSLYKLAKLSIQSVVSFSSAPMKIILFLGGLYFIIAAFIFMKMLYDYFFADIRVAGIPTLIALILGRPIQFSRFS